MNQEWEFQYSVRRSPAGGVIELTAEEMEKHLLDRLKNEPDSVRQILCELGRFYGDMKQEERAIACFREVLNREPDLERKAACVLAMGATMEQVGNFQGAVRFYKEAFSMEPTHTDTWYFINNNLGYSLNQLGRYEDGLDFCRRAVEIDPKRFNAHKNVGISLAALGRFAEAAECFVTATRLNASDSRALGHLEDLLKEHPELSFEFENKLELCRQAVSVARKAYEAAQPVVRRGWRRRLFIWRMKLRMYLRRILK